MEQKLGWRAVFGTQPDSFEVTRESSSFLPSSPKIRTPGAKNVLLKVIQLNFLLWVQILGSTAVYGTAPPT
jgi:hypothetical protein